MFTEKTYCRDILIFLFLVSVFLLALSKIVDVDAWIHLSFGRLIWELKSLPDTEPFVYPMLEMPFSYTSWFFGFLYYIAYLVSDIYGLGLLKGIIISTVFYILLKDSLLPHKNHIITVILLSAVAIVMQERFVIRPDTFLMIFLPFSIYTLNAFVSENKKYLYSLPLIHILWANSHSSITLMFIPFLSFIAGGLLQAAVNNKWKHFFDISLSRAQLKTIAMVFVISLTASLISPYFLSQYTFGGEIMSADWYRQEITELLPLGSEHFNWEHKKWPYIMIAFVLISFLLNIRHFSLIHFFLVIPFLMLPFTSVRFIFVMGVTAAPVLIKNLSQFISGKQVSMLFNSKPAAAMAGLWIILCTSLAFVHIEPFGNKGREFGFGFNFISVPESALGYMDRRGIKGRIFNTFHWGQFIIWRNFPERTPFVDGRGYLPVDLLEKLETARINYQVLDELYSAYGFESILVDYPIEMGSVSVLAYEIDISLKHPEWALVYWDDISLLYLKRDGIYSSIIEKDEYKFIKPANNISGVRSLLKDTVYQQNVIRELKRNINETGSSRAYSSLGFVYNQMGRYNAAIDVFSKVVDSSFTDHLATAYSGIAYAYHNMRDIDNAILYYKKSLDIKKDSSIFYNIGIAYKKKGDKKGVIKYLKEALELNGNLLSIYPQLIGIYQELGMKDDEISIMKLYEMAKIESEGEKCFKNALKAYMEKRIKEASGLYQKCIEANPSNPAPYSNLGYIYFDINMLGKAYQYQKKAVDIDPNFANAHYGIALIYKKWQNMKMAKKHWQEYLRIEPSGYFSRKSKEEIRAIKN